MSTNAQVCLSKDLMQPAVSRSPSLSFCTSLGLAVIPHSKRPPHHDLVQACAGRQCASPLLWPASHSQRACVEVPLSLLQLCHPVTLVRTAERALPVAHHTITTSLMSHADMSCKVDSRLTRKAQPLSATRGEGDLPLYRDQFAHLEPAAYRLRPCKSKNRRS